MELSNKTITILKNFAQINNSIYCDEPGYLKTRTPNSTNIIAVAKIEEELPELAIYSLNEFVGSMSLFSRLPINFKFDENFITMEEDSMKIKYRLSDPDHILAKCKSAADYEAYDDFDCNFELTEEQLQSIQKAARVLGADTFHITLENGKGSLSLINSELPMSNSFEMDIEGTGTGEIKFFVENLLIITGNYSINYTNDRALKFTNKDIELFYFISSCQV